MPQAAHTPSPQSPCLLPEDRRGSLRLPYMPASLNCNEAFFPSISTESTPPHPALPTPPSPQCAGSPGVRPSPQHPLQPGFARGEMQQSGLAAKFSCCFSVSIYLQLLTLPPALWPQTELALPAPRQSFTSTIKKKERNEKETSRDNDGRKEKGVSAGLLG